MNASSLYRKYRDQALHNAVMSQANVGISGASTVSTGSMSQITSGLTGASTPPTINPYNAYVAPMEHYSLKHLLALRLEQYSLTILHGASSVLTKFQFCEPVLTEEKVFVFIVHENQPVIIEDSREMFPSDGLVTQIRLLLG